MTVGRIPNVEGGIQPTLLTTKGDIIAATSASNPDRLAVGTNDLVLTAASGETTGLKWSGNSVAWTPTFDNLTVGNGTLSASYVKVGKYIYAWLRLIFGSTTSITGAVRVTGLPVAPVSNNAAVCAIVQSTYADASGNIFWGSSHASNNNTTRIWLSPMTISGSYIRNDVDLSSTTPFTWTSTDTLSVAMAYEGA